jgi:bifunctional ADP-heptose synthase (sugar kinase/adenylyltransferase)
MSNPDIPKRELLDNTIVQPILLYPKWNITLDEIRCSATRHNKTIVYTFGRFDVIQSAQLQQLNFCKMHGNIIVVGISSEYAEVSIPILCELNFIDYIYAVCENDTQILEKLNPNVVVCVAGSDAADAADAVAAVKNVVFFTPHKPSL